MRALLVMLLLDAGRVVTVERLIGGLYGADPPANAANALQSQVSRLRRTLGAQETIEFHPAGYRLVAGADAVDAHRFEGLAAEGRRTLASGEYDRAVELLGEALSLWRGPALADVGESPFAPAPSARLERLRLDCVEDRVQAELELGRHRELVAELQGLTAAHPFRERLYGQPMRALYGSGRQAEALEVYEGARRILGEEFGVDPSAERAAPEGLAPSGPSRFRPLTFPVLRFSGSGVGRDLDRLAHLADGRGLPGVVRILRRKVPGDFGRRGGRQSVGRRVPSGPRSRLRSDGESPKCSHSSVMASSRRISVMPSTSTCSSDRSP